MKTRAARLVLLGTAVLFVAALWRLFDLRFAAGDVYPPGSTLRADPQGSRALFESLRRLPGPDVQRRLEPLRTLRGGAGTTLFLLGVDPEDRWLDPPAREALNNFLATGGRLVATFTAAVEKTRPTNAPPPVAVPADHSKDVLSLLQFSELKLSPAPPKDGAPYGVQGAVRTPAAPAYLPGEIPWRSPAAFDAVPTNWSTLFTRAGEPVVIARTQGRGTVVLLGDNWLLTNEALRHERAPSLLAWLVGPSRHVLFDETHLGTQLDPGVMTLTRRYGLTGFMLGLLFVAALYIWRASSSLVPRVDSALEQDAEIITGRDSATGFVNLLRRSVTPAELLPLCLHEWRQSVPRDRADLQRKAAEMQDLVNLEADRPPREQNPVPTYRQLAEILARR